MLGRSISRARLRRSPFCSNVRTLAEATKLNNTNCANTPGNDVTTTQEESGWSRLEKNGTDYKQQNWIRLLRLTCCRSHCCFTHFQFVFSFSFSIFSTRKGDHWFFNRSWQPDFDRTVCVRRGLGALKDFVPKGLHKKWSACIWRIVAVEGVGQDRQWSPIIFLKSKLYVWTRTLSEGSTKKRANLKTIPRALARLNVRSCNLLTTCIFLARFVFHNKEGQALDSLLLIRTERKICFWQSARKFSDCMLYPIKTLKKTSWISPRRNGNRKEIITNLPRKA